MKTEFVVVLNSNEDIFVFKTEHHTVGVLANGGKDCVRYVIGGEEGVSGSVETICGGKNVVVRA